jgi:ribose transport system substrate-binding protein
VSQRLGRPGHLLVVSVAIALLLTACSSTKSEDAPNGDGPKADSVQAEAESLIKDVIARPTSIGITTPVGKPIPKGKTVAFMTCSLSSCGEIEKIAEGAAAILGWNVKKINIGVTPETIKAGYAQAVELRPDAVMGTGFEPTLFAPELKQLNSMNVPVMLGSVGSKTYPGITAAYISGEYSTNSGAKQADWTIAQHGTGTKTLTIDVPDLHSIQGWATGFKTEYKRLCPQCSLGSVSVSSADIGTPKVASQVTSYVQQHPDINMIQMATSSLAYGLPQALSPIGSKAQIGVVNADDTVRSYMKQNRVQVSNAIDWPSVVYKMFDTAARTFTGQPIDPDLNAAESEWLFTPDNIPEGSGYNTPIVLDYQDQFKKLWGITS